MRLNLRLTANEETVPYSNVRQLLGVFHGWMGENELHDGLSLYSLGWLRGNETQTNGDGLEFPRGASWRLSFHDPKAAKAVIGGIIDDPTVAWGMRVFEVKEQDVPQFSGCYRFKVDSPVLARADRDGRDTRRHYLWKDKEADEVLTRVLRRKLEAVGFTGDALDTIVQFDRTYEGARSKLVQLKDNIELRASFCPVVVTGAPEAVRFAWKVGVGELTGSGFGALR